MGKIGLKSVEKLSLRMKNLLPILLLLFLLGSCQSSTQTAKNAYDEGLTLSFQADSLRTVGQEQEARIAWNEAIVKFEEALVANKEHPLAESAAAFCFYQLQSFKLAELEYKKAMEKMPESSINVLYLGLSQVAQDRIEEGRASLNRALSLDDTGKTKEKMLQELGGIAENAFTHGVEKEDENYINFALGVLLTAWEFSPDAPNIRALLKIVGQRKEDPTLRKWLEEEEIM